MAEAAVSRLEQVKSLHRFFWNLQPLVNTCSNGHLLIPENIYNQPDGRWHCRSCVRMYQRKEGEPLTPEFLSRTAERDDFLKRGVKRCCMCKEIKAFSEFKYAARALGGVVARCMACHLEESKFRSKLPREQLRRAAYTRKYLRDPHKRFIVAGQSAKTRSLVWDIPEALFLDLIQKACHYCDGPLSETGSGLDRKDSNLGYAPENVVPCCWLCNKTKNNYFSYQEMLTLIGPAVKRIRADRIANGQGGPHGW